MELMKLCREDEFQVRQRAPPFMLRLGKDQECYDFIKWWDTIGIDPNHNFRDLRRPHLDIRNSNAFESVETFLGRHSSLTMLVCLMLVKIKLLLDLKRLKDTQILETKLPTELIDHIRQYIPMSQIISSRSNLINQGEWKKEIKSLNQQVSRLFDLVHSANPFYWNALLNPTSHLGHRPLMGRLRSPQQMQQALNYTYTAWIETDGAISLIKSIVVQKSLA